MATLTQPPIGVVAGSGIELTPLLDAGCEEIPFTARPGMPSGGVQGHDYRFLRGRCGPVDLVLQCGRFHAYEGLSYEDVVRPVETLHAWGVHTILFTNAAGGLLPAMNPGDLLAVNQIRAWPCTRFNLPEKLPTDILLPGCDFTGAYAWMHGPCYETRAEIHALQALGCAAVGMSAAPEVFRCRALGIRAAVVSCITNSCVTPNVLNHHHVLEIAQKSSARLCGVLRAYIGAIRTGRRET